MTTNTNNSTNKKIRVCVGLSGGVDSSVTAALLKQQGYEVIGVYMKNWNTESPTLGGRQLEQDAYRMECPWYDDYLDAKRVALQLEIPFQMWDFREAYKQKVFDEFLAEYEKGRTPNPDIYCNSRVKFEDFQQKALTELGADYVATGHYARVIQEDGRFQLQIPSDQRKDQTYFLYRLTQEQLSRALFPLADYTKEQVRELAQQFNLPTKYKKDSQGICFVGQVEIRQFLQHWLAEKPGEIHDLDGRVIGRHNGAHFLTIGERVAVDNALVARHYPELKQSIPHFYVAEKRADDNVVIAVPGADHPALFKQEVVLEQVTWSIGDPAGLARLKARVRHGGQLVVVASLELLPDQQTTLRLEQPQRALAPGQHLVLYDEKDRVVGGGIMAY